MRKKRYNVLVFPGGTEVGLEIFRAMRYCKEVVLFSASNSTANHSTYVYANHVTLPSVADPDCLTKLIDALIDFRIDFIYPANPLVIDFLNRHRKKIPCHILMSSAEVLDITRSKTKTYKVLGSLIPVPRIYHGSSADYKFPVFIKPDSMYGSQGARLESSLESFVANPPNSNEITCEYLPGEEYSIDCFSNYEGRLLFASPRTRERIRMGTSMHCEDPSDIVRDKLIEYAELIQSKIPMRGAWFFQVKADESGVLKLLEVEARIAGTMAFNRVRGINFPLMTLFDALEINLNILRNQCVTSIDRSLYNRFHININYSTVYVDLDDTLIVKDKLNIQLISFLYQCVNSDKKIILLSKSLSNDPNSILKRWRISELFDSVHWLEEEESKADYIRDGNAIFIDDSFSQRKEVSEKLGISTFDASMIECLLDERGF